MPKYRRTTHRTWRGKGTARVKLTRTVDDFAKRPDLEEKYVQYNSYTNPDAPRDGTVVVETIPDKDPEK